MLFLLIFLISLIAQFLLPWWSIALVCFLVAAWKAKFGGHAFLAGFGAIALTWLGGALFWYLTSGTLLTQRVSAMLTINSSWILIIVTTILGGLVGGISAVAGFYTRQALKATAPSPVSG